MLDFLRSKDKRFFILLQQATANMVKMAKELSGLIHDWDYVKERVSILADLEADGDAITHDIMKLLYRNFLTPLDREDIGRIAKSIDDVADRIHAAADVLLLYRVEGPTDKAKEMGDILAQITGEVEQAILAISNHIDHEELLVRAKEINHLENLGDTLYQAALADLFDNSVDDAFLVKWRKIYELMESAIDGCEVVSDVLEGIAIKYA